MDSINLEQQPDNIPLFEDQRSALRGSVLNALFRLSEDSIIYTMLKFSFSSIKIITIIVIISITTNSTDKPLDTFIYILLSVECLNILIYSYYIFTIPESRTITFKSLINNLDYLAGL